MGKIAVVNVPFYSHAGASLRLTGVFVRQGHEVAVWGPEQFRSQAEAWGVTFERYEPPVPDAGGPAEVVASVAATAEGQIAPLIEALHKRGADVLVHDSRLLWARVAGDYLGLPRIVAHPMFPLVAPHRVGLSQNPRGDAAQEERVRERWESSWLAIARRWGVEIEDSASAIHARADTTFAFTTDEILGNHALPPGWHCIGPLMPPPLPRGPEPTRPLVYVCFGTTYNDRVNLFRAVIEALGGQPYDVLISLGGGPVSPAGLGALPDNVDVQRFVPAREVLARASVHLTHSGCNSVHETLLAAVPMVCIPQAYDQFPLARRVAELGAGVVCGENPYDIRDAVQLLLGSTKARARVRELSEHLLHYDGERRVGSVLEALLSHDRAVTAGSPAPGSSARAG